MRSALAAAAVLAAVLLAPPCRVHAQSADALLDEGIALREARRDEDALARFERAHQLEPSGRALAQIALAEQALGRLAQAEAHLAEALADEDDRFVRRNRELLEQALAEISSHLGELQVVGPAGAEVRVDDEEVGTLPLAAPLRRGAGTVHVIVRAPFQRPFETDATIAPGTRVVVRAALAPIVAASETAAGPTTPIAPTPGPARSSPGWAMPVAIGTAGAGVIGVAIGAGLAVVREDHAQARLTCSDSDPACAARYGAAIDAENGAIAAFAIGGVLVAAGATLLVLDLLGTLDEPAPRETLACAPGALALACTGRF